MSILPVHRFFIFNGEIKPVSDFVPSENEGGVYEVLRIIRRVPLFLEDHLDRFAVSAMIAKKTIRFSNFQIKAFLHELVEKNDIEAGNVLISCKKNLKTFFIKHQYPTPEMYLAGVKCGILHAERKQPNAKVFQTSVRQRADKLMEQNGFYEVILVDHLQRVTEGSRSNVFFVRRNEIITPPAHEVLLGITRQKIISLAKSNNLRAVEEDVKWEDLKNFQAAFITGTSPKILPIKQIDEIRFDPQNKIVRQLIRSYDDLIERYRSKNTIVF